ncbi:MAG: DUF1549 domain-containing protein, partial [Verrucomicrobiota bacterium]
MKSARFFRLLGALVLIPTLVVISTVILSMGLETDPVVPMSSAIIPDEALEKIARVDAAFKDAWAASDTPMTAEADPLTLVRRLSLSLTGATPSLEEIRRLGSLPEEADPVQSWLTHLFADPRYHHYFSERLTRAFVGVEPGPFLVYRR